MEALDVFTKMLNFINEYKRRKYLVSKYLSTSSEELTITDMIKKINFKAISKTAMVQTAFPKKYINHLINKSLEFNHYLFF